VLAAFDRRRLRMLAEAAAPPGALLDAGAGRGRFVLAARRAGWRAEGLEPAARDAVVGLRRASIEDAPIAEGSLDAVVLWHVLEHLDDPAAALARVRGWLRPGGGLLVGVPNLGSLQARLGGERWFHLDPARHRVHLTAEGTRALLERTGFAPVAEHHVLLEHNPFGMWQTLVNRAARQPSHLFAVLKREARPDAQSLAVTLAALPLAPLAAALELAAGLARRGGTIAVSARRA
jgi:SAM-dependent methyltransferase